MLSSEWRKPFNISIGLHIIIVALAILAPNLFERQPRLPEIYTVNLFTASEVEQISPAPAESPAAKPAIKQIEPEVKKPAISIQPAKPEISPAAPKAVKPISLKPVKEKIKVGKTKAEDALEKAKLSRVVQRLKTKAEADRAARDAVSKLADSLKAYAPAPTTSGAAAKPVTGQTGSTTKTGTISGPKGTGLEPDFYMKQYLSAVYQKIHDHWILPDLQNWDNALEAVLSIRIREDGTVENSYFEKKSDNIYFNQFVLKAVKESSPLPPFPDQLEEDTLEVGLRFKPGELY
jgi:colicin import membrane protein